MNRFIYYYRVFDIVVNQTKGVLYWGPLHCLAYLKMGIVEGKTKKIRGTNPLLRDKFPLQRSGRGLQWLTTKASRL